MNVTWIEYEGKNGTCVYTEIEIDGFTYELGVVRINDRHDKMYNWYLETTEIFGEVSNNVVGSLLADSCCMTINEGMQYALDAFFNREEYRQNWIDSLPYI